MTQRGGLTKGKAARGARWRAALVAAIGAALVGGTAARASTSYDVLPSATLGVTDNASAAPTGSNRFWDGFMILTALARAHALTAHSDNSLGLRLSDTFYLLGHGPTALIAELAGISDLTLSSAWKLRLAGGLTYGQTSSPAGLDVNASLPTVLPAFSNPYLLGGASEEGLYDVDLRSRILEALRFTGVHYLRRQGQVVIGPSGAPIANSFLLGGTLRFEREFGQNLFTLEGDAADSVAPGRGPGLATQVLLAHLLAGWRREVGVSWAAELKGGALGVFDFQGTSVVEPAGFASIGYRRIAWFATLSAEQSAVPNIFIAAATISDQVLGRLALPLDRSERAYVMGYGGYTYARLLDSAGTHRGYELRTAGASLTARSERIPLWGSLDLTFSSQLGNKGPGLPGTIPDIERLALMLTVGWVFSTDHEVPPIFHGVMGAVRPLDDVSGRSPAQGSPSGLPSGGSSGSGSWGSSSPGWSSSPPSGGSGGSGSGNVDNVTR
jgi:hypothetical protein